MTTDTTILALRAGQISPEVALARILLRGGSPEAEIAALRRTDPRLAHSLDRVLERVDTMAHTQRMLHEAGRGPAPGRLAARAYFDHAAAISPEASVALYSLGDPALLARATQEVRDWLLRQGLLRPGLDVLDLGCGHGRIAAAIAPHVGTVLGTDISSRMIAEARSRHGRTRNLRFRLTEGEGLEMIGEASLDLILAVDSFPYIVADHPALKEAHLAGARRVLRPGGRLVILNYSYHGDPAAHAAELAANRHLLMESWHRRPFRLWDGSAFILGRA